jgi:hypothetical protein
MPIGPIAGAIGSAVIGASASRSASRAQEAAANRQLELERDIYDETTARFAPFYDTGLDYTNALRYELLGGERPTFGGDPLAVTEFTETIPGLPGRQPAYGDQGGMIRDPNDPERFIDPITLDRERTRYRVGDQVFDEREAADEYAAANPTGGYEYQGFEATPYQDYVLKTARRQIDNSAASRGSLFSGATLKAQQDRGNALAGAFYGDYLNRLTGQAGQGQAAAGNMATAGANYASGAGNALANIGNAQAAGAVGTANALTGGINNAIGLWNYQNMQNNTAAPTSSLFPQTRPWG